MTTIELKEISKEIKRKTILQKVSLTFVSGKIYGIVGKNGSGKTVLMKTILGLIMPSEGEVFVNGNKVLSGKMFPESVGVMIENNGLWPELNAYDNLRLLASINRTIDKSDIIDSIRRVGLDPTSKKAFSKLSLGMKQRLVLAQAIMEKPKVLLLDEPTNSLDEEGIQLLYDIILEEKRRGCLVILSSHSEEFINSLCDEIIRVDRGIFVQEEKRS